LLRLSGLPGPGHETRRSYRDGQLDPQRLNVIRVAVAGECAEHEHGPGHFDTGHRPASDSSPLSSRLRTPRRPIALVGLMGAGKTSVGRLLARRLDREFIDMDAELSREVGMSLARSFATLGEVDFRRRESRLLKKLSARRDGPVVATGGGAVLQGSNQGLLRTRFDTYWLDISAAEAWRRLATARGRPLLLAGPGSTPLARLVRLARARRTLYAASGRRLRATGRTPAELAESVAARVGRVATDQGKSR